VKLFAGPAPACISREKQLKIARLYLRQAWCGQGIGAALLKRCEVFAQEKRYEAIWLTVWEHNPGALKLYGKFGFKIVGEEDFVLGQDVQRDFIMEKVL
jgi:ribosomal protein S18 acetylase RimI-like enzyme